MQITLVRPTTFLNAGSHPLNIGYIYSALTKGERFHVDFVDGERVGLKYAGIKDDVNKLPTHPMWKEIADQILASAPDMVAFSCYSLSMTPVAYLIELLRSSGFKRQIWAGGIHVTTCPMETLQRIDGLDGVIMGEGEVTVVELCQTLQNDGDLAKVAGICYRKNGEITFNPPREMLKDLDDLPLPTRIFPKKYRYVDHLLL